MKYCGKKVKYDGDIPYITRNHKDGYTRRYFGEIRICINCNTNFFSLYGNAVFCSCDCLGAYRSGEKNPYWRGGKSKVHGYIIIYLPEHPFNNGGYVREHRLKMEKKLGRYLKQGEDVHHINGIRDDNRLKNLQLLTHGEHTTLTNNKRWSKCQKTN
jgi:hypothetical protein